MKTQDKQLLLKDLCARLPYGVMVHCEWSFFKEGRGQDDGLLEEIDVIKKNIRFKRKDCSTNIPFNHIDGVVLPYLRPMSSMTKEEREFMEELSEFKCTPDKALMKIDFYLKHHIDFRGLIPMGLALEATEGMYEE